MGMGRTQGAFYFLTAPVECSELQIPLDHEEKDIFNKVILPEEIERLYMELTIVSDALVYDQDYFAVTKHQYTRNWLLIDYSE